MQTIGNDVIEQPSGLDSRRGSRKPTGREKGKRGETIKLPKRIIVEYEDGSANRIDFNKLSRSAQLEISRAGLGSPSLAEYSKSYLLLKWKDGWQEVVAIDGDSIELLRYYVIRRIEDIGRLSLEVGTSCPQLFIINRLPRDLDSLLIVDNDDAKYYELKSEVETCEGFFEAGGKREYTKYDKTDPAYPQGFRQGDEVMAGLLNSLKCELDKDGLRAEELLTKDEETKIIEYEQIAWRMGTRGKERQKDVYGFMELIVTKLATSVV